MAAAKEAPPDDSVYALRVQPLGEPERVLLQITGEGRVLVFEDDGVTCWELDAQQLFEVLLRFRQN